MRRALLMLDSDLPPEPVLLTDAARRATELGDVELAVRVARAAIAAGGGFEPRLLLGNALIWSGRGAQGVTELAALGDLATTDAERAQAGIPRLGALAFTLARPAEAEATLDAIMTTISDDAAALELASSRTVLDAYLGRTVKAVEAATAVLGHPQRTRAATQMATWGLAAACGGLGRLDGLDETLRRIDARVESSEIGLHQAALVASLWLRGLVLAALLDQAEHTARQYRNRCQGGLAGVLASWMCGEVAKSRGQVRTAARWHRQAIAAIHGADPGGLSFLGLIGLTAALGMAGETPPARRARADMTAARHPTFTFLEPLAASTQLEAMGALLPAADAAAQAAIQHRARGAAAQAAFASARAARLAHRCEDARTPALLAGTAPLPLSTREREVATMVATGLSNKQIAARLHVSIRTVEGHIYRACTRLGVTNRTAPAAQFSGPSAGR